jgi:hypothetical protein
MEELVKKLLLPLLALSILALLSGCATPQAVDMTGKWNYKYGKKLEDSEFEGDYTTDTGTSGKIEAERNLYRKK